MIREWADKKQLAKIADALKPPAGWVDPSTGLPPGWTDNEEDDWSAWQQAMRR